MESYKSDIYRQHCAQHNAPVLSYSQADFEIFRPTGATRCTDGVKFGAEERTFGPLLHANFHPHQWGIGHPKLKFFTEI